MQENLVKMVNICFDRYAPWAPSESLEDEWMGRLRLDFGERGWTRCGKRNAWGTDDDERCAVAAKQGIHVG